ncbi:MAG: AMP-binding protein [Anaerolineales bacterium]|nr:AMP-binding protein [Anaerolineales bacterium]
MSPLTFSALLSDRAQAHPQAIAILGLDRRPLTYQGLSEQVGYVVRRLNELGVGREDRVALVLPNGPEMAVAFLTIACAATCAPLNPAYRSSEFDFFLSDLDARALVIAQGMDSPAISVARQHAIPIIELLPDPQTAGLFELQGPPQSLRAQAGMAQEDEVALVLHTSGTTSRPKIVPLTQRNLLNSAANIQQTLALTTADRCLNIMPLFHIHGLMAATLASLSAGASLVCTPGFYAPDFFGWMERFEPTWYTAVPTMHQAILARAADHPQVLEKVQLRFVRSSSSSLPPQVMAELERVFQAPVIEAYGMTEASHQMASNPLPPLARKPGSVGLEAGPQVAIMAENGPQLLPAGEIGEIVIRGENVTRGYANNPEANARAFEAGWFRTGDQGYLDGEGYLFITGRLKEIINRGGEKISPREIDEVLLDHPAVTQALAFALPDESLGEDVAAAVVVNDAAISEGELRRFAALKLVDFKVPRRILILDEIPKGPTGKLQRIGLAEKLGLTGQAQPASTPVAYAAPQSEAEIALAELWQEILKVPQIGVHHRFLDLGGDSVLATRLLARVEQEFAVKISILDFFDAPTIAAQAELVENLILAEFEQLSDDELQALQ